MGLWLNDLYLCKSCGGVLIKGGWHFYDPTSASAAMTALTDIQRSLNAIRAIERDSSADVRLAALALLAATTADIAKELRGVNAPKQPPKQPIKAPPIPPPSPTNQPQTEPPQQKDAARPFTEPEQQREPE